MILMGRTMGWPPGEEAVLLVEEEKEEKEHDVWNSEGEEEGSGY